MWRAIRYGLSGDLLDFDRGEPIPARRRLEQLLEWVAPVADEIGVASYLSDPRERTPPNARSNGWREGASLRGDLRRAGRRPANQSASACWFPSRNVVHNRPRRSPSALDFVREQN